MKEAVYCNGIKLQKENFDLEEDFEKEVKNNSKKLFGEKTIYLDIKKKIESASLGGTIPDGILFDLEDPEDIKFYLVEIELAKHSFYEHIFPQITKFFAFYKNQDSQNNLIEKLFYFIKSNNDINKSFTDLLKGQELYKSIKDAIENNAKILLIIDDNKLQIEEVQRIYSDTWDKLVIPEILSKYKKDETEVFILEPDFSEKEIIESKEIEKEPEKRINYTENYHLEGVESFIFSIYNKIKNKMKEIDPSMIFNPQKYYISIKKNKNFAYLDIKKKKIKIAVMLPYTRGQEIIKNHKLREFTEGIKKFYGGPSFEVKIESEENLDEVFNLLEEAYKKQQ